MTSHVFQRDLTDQLPVAVRGVGVHVTDAEGKRYLDAVGGVAVNIVGHGVPEITAELAARREELCYTYGAVFTSPAQEELADRLLAMSPFSEGAVYFTSGGSEANEVAVKLARQYHLERGHPTKWKVVSRWQSYHGNTLAMNALSGRPSWRQDFDPYFPQSPKMGAPYVYRADPALGEAQLVEQWANELERLIFHEGPATISAFLAEPVSGSSLVGAVPPPGYYERIREICDRHDILFIADEVLCGYGRTGRNFAIEHWASTPDIITAGKGIGSGYVPIAACILASHVVSAIANGSRSHTQGFTYSGTAFATHIGVQVNRYVLRHGLIARADSMGHHLQNRLKDLAAREEAVGDVRGLGLLAGVELVADRDTKSPFPASQRIAQRVVQECRRRGVLLLPGTPGAALGDGGDLIQITPPYVITENQVDEVVGVLGEAITAVVRGS
jgi:adenosylmethionine-8-amino-7-oxononanoate aminotransferase